ncbi:MAG: DEAD/DEAH box helicase family protein [Kofleriaceae bacterium]|nr:DEAD/DEAH box helicase family protein [Kofleriaceae bacterium]
MSNTDDGSSDEYLTIQQAAARVGVSIATLRRWDSDGKLRAVRNPANAYRLYRVSDLEQFRPSYAHAASAAAPNLFVTTAARIGTNTNLRDPQRFAHREVLKHFGQSSEPATIQIPVGCGKTGLMTLLPFGLCRGRVLVIAPNVTIRDGIVEALELNGPKNFLRNTGALTDFSDGPFTAVLDGPRANLHDCIESHFVVTNIQQLASSADRWLPQFPEKFFDLILIDEGHHNAAPSWRKVFERFPDARVVSLTATPFRADGKPVSGQLVYSYPFTQAMMKGYIKTITAYNAAPAELTFSYRGDTRTHTLEEVLALREEQWFRKGVALSVECNRAIVDKSLQKLQALRTETGHPHQLIAVACSVDHARQVRALYEERGMRAREIYGEMDEEERDQVLALLRQGRLDCIVQVQMLGEGFDHPNLSVAAIFRPYRSLSPYIQFVGRVMRVVKESAPGDPNNHGFVVSHVGLNNEEHWDDFRAFDLADQDEVKRWLHEQEADGSDQERGERTGGGQPRRFDTLPSVAGEVISHFVRDDFLNPEDDRLIEKLLDSELPGLPLKLRDVITAEQLRASLREKFAARGPREEPPAPVTPVAPQKKRQVARERLDERIGSVAARALADLNLGRAGRELARAEGKSGRVPNGTLMTTLLNQAVNDHVGRESKTRKDWPREDVERAFNDLDSIADTLVRRLRPKL